MKINDMVYLNDDGFIGFENEKVFIGESNGEYFTSKIEINYETYLKIQEMVEQKIALKHYHLKEVGSGIYNIFEPNKEKQIAKIYCTPDTKQVYIHIHGKEGYYIPSQFNVDTIFEKIGDLI